MNQICYKCTHKTICKDKGIPCAALSEFMDIYNADNTKVRRTYIRALARKLEIRDAEPSKELQVLAEAIINKFPELAFINSYGIKIGYVLSYEKKSGEKITYADCRKVNTVYQSYLPFDFIITFYQYNTEILNENQLKVLMLHELKHIQVTTKGMSVKPHDIEDFKDIIIEYGLNWNEQGKEIPDILSEGVD